MMMMVRMEILSSRGAGRFALTAARRAAREKKLAARSPKKKMNRDTNRRGRKRKNLEFYYKEWKKNRQIHK